MVRSKWVRMSELASKYGVVGRGFSPLEMVKMIDERERAGKVTVSVEDRRLMVEIMGEVPEGAWKETKV